MKAVIYHADSHFAWGSKPGDFYKHLFGRLRFEMPVIHLTCVGHPIWGDEGLHFDLDPKNVVANREECFAGFLEYAPDDVYWFTEPDCEILHPFPALKKDAAFLYRPGDDVPMTPSWRLARPKAFPLFDLFREEMRKDHRKDWHGDSAALTASWKRLGSPQEDFEYQGLQVEMRPYADYVKPGRYTKNNLGQKKLR